MVHEELDMTDMFFFALNRFSFPDTSSIGQCIFDMAITFVLRVIFKTYVSALDSPDFDLTHSPSDKFVIRLAFSPGWYIWSRLRLPAGDQYDSVVPKEQAYCQTSMLSSK